MRVSEDIRVGWLKAESYEVAVESSELLLYRTEVGQGLEKGACYE